MKMKNAILALIIFSCITTFGAKKEAAEATGHKLGKQITGKIVDAKGTVLKTDLSKKKYLVFYYTASW